MSTTGLEVFDTTIQKTNKWLNDIAGRLDLKGPDARRKSYIALRSTMHILRDRLTVEEAAHFGAQLPMLIRGIYYEGWDPSNKPVKIRDKSEFLSVLDYYFSGENDIGHDAEDIAKVVLQVASKNVTESEMEDIRNSMPKNLRGLWPR